jgi:hypothetical protein
MEKIPTDNDYEESSESDGVKSSITGYTVMSLDSIVGRGNVIPSEKVFVQMEYKDFGRFLNDTLLTRRSNSLMTYVDPKKMLMISSESMCRYFPMDEYRLNPHHTVESRLQTGEIFLLHVLGDITRVNFRIFVIPIWMNDLKNHELMDCLIHVYYYMIPNTVTLIEKYNGVLSDMVNFIKSLSPDVFEGNFSVDGFMSKINLCSNPPEMDPISVLSTVLRIGEMFTVFYVQDNRYSINYNVNFISIKPS